VAKGQIFSLELIFKTKDLTPIFYQSSIDDEPKQRAEFFLISGEKQKTEGTGKY